MSPRIRRGWIIACALLPLSAGCATRPPTQREWRVVHDGGDASLVYGRRGATQADFAVVCDVAAGIADLVYPIGAATDLIQGTRTELLVAVGDSVDNLPAEVGVAADGGLTVVARTVLPPSPVATWAGQQLTVGAAGLATTLTNRPSRTIISAFLKACRR